MMHPKNPGKGAQTQTEACQTGSPTPITPPHPQIPTSEECPPSEDAYDNKY
jgi:hypothetical protein